MAMKAAQKPQKAGDIPLFLHATGQWAKKINGKTRYFGVDQKKALAKYRKEKDDLQAGREPSDSDGLTMRELANRFLTAKKHAATAGEISQRHFRNLHLSCARLIRHFGPSAKVAGLRPLDFERLRVKLARGRGLYALANELRHARMLFKYGYDAVLLERPVRFGPSFKLPTKKALRIDRQSKGPRFMEAAELRRVIEAAENPLRAMILLGLNAGFGNTDISSLPQWAVNLKTGTVSFPRPKTGVERKAFLWPETVAALQEAIAERPEPKDPADSDLVFITKYGGRFVRSDGTVQVDAVGQEFAKVLKRLDLKRRGSFYVLRHTAETIGGASRDQVAVNHIMGHVDSSMAAAYREHIDDDRLRAVADHIHAWLFVAEQTQEGGAQSG